MAPIRVALIDMSRMLNQIVEAALACRPEVELVANVSGSGVLPSSVATEFVVAGDDGIDDPEIARLLAERPLVRVLVIRDDGRSSFLFDHGLDGDLDKGLEGIPLGEMSSQRLLAVICSGERAGKG